MQAIRFGTIVAVISALAATVSVYKDREYMAQLGCSIVKLVGEFRYCNSFAAIDGEKLELPLRGKREAVETSQRLMEAEERARAAEAARRKAEDNAITELARARQAEIEAQYAERRQNDAEARARAAEAIRLQTDVGVYAGASCGDL